MGRTGKLSRRVIVWSSLTAGLLMASAPGVLAADPASKTRAGGSGAGHGAAAKDQATPAEQRAPASDSRPESPNAVPTADNTARAGEYKPNAGEKKSGGGGKKPKAGEKKSNAGEKASRAETAGQRTSRSGPSGNNGTVKIDGVPFDTHPSNQPHVGCRFQVDFYGFDEGDLYATVRFALQSPSTDGRLEVTGGSTRVFMGEDDSSGGGSVRGLDAQETYTLDFAGVTPHRKQGYHVKVTVHADGSRGADTKHKVFWVEPCGGVMPAIAGTTATTTTPPADQPGAVGGTEQVQNQGQAGAPGNPNPNGPAVLGVTLERSAPARVAGTEQSRVAGIEQARLTASPPAAGTNAGNRTRVLGTTLERSALARTGLNIFEVTTLGALLVLAGYAAVRVCRRKTGHSAESTA